MNEAVSLTIPQLAKLLQVPDWKARRVVDGLNIDVQRVGLYRLIPAAALPAIRAELQRQNWLPTTEGGDA